MSEANNRSKAQIGNQNAVKDDPATSILHARCRPDQKALWVKAANGLPLSQWVLSVLDAAAESALQRRGVKIRKPPGKAA